MVNKSIALLALLHAIALLGAPPANAGGLAGSFSDGEEVVSSGPNPGIVLVTFRELQG